MDIKIRTQSKVSLVDCTNKSIGVTGRGKLNTVIAGENSNVIVLGSYETEGRAMEILDSIENAIDFGIKHDNHGIIIQMPEK